MPLEHSRDTDPAFPCRAEHCEGFGMRKIVSGLYVSLDGVVESGWTGVSPNISPNDPITGPYFNDPEVNQAVGALMARNDAMLMGRITYEGFLPFFSGQSGPYFDTVNAMPKYVVSTTMRTAQWQNTTVLNENLADEIAELKDQPGEVIGVGGSPTLVRWLLAEGLLDELHLMLFPVVLGGAGARLYTEDMEVGELRLTGADTLACGVVNLHYVPK